MEDSGDITEEDGPGPGLGDEDPVLFTLRARTPLCMSYIPNVLETQQQSTTGNVMNSQGF